MKYNINLLTKKTAGFFDKTLYFFLNYLRYILVVTQLVVIGVLFFRFSIDQRIIDLKESIDQKKAIIDAISPLNTEAREINNQLIETKNITSSQDKISQTLAYIFSIFPDGATLTNFNLEKNVMTMTGIAIDVRALQAFYDRLKKENKFSAVNLEDLARKETGFDFTLIIRLF